jgi:hypothetical protein
VCLAGYAALPQHAGLVPDHDVSVYQVPKYHAGYAVLPQHAGLVPDHDVSVYQVPKYHAGYAALSHHAGLVSDLDVPVFWYLCIMMGMQHYLTMLGWYLTMLYLCIRYL